MTWTVKTRKTAEELEERITRLSRTLSGAHDETSARMRAALRSEEQSLKE